ncbi:L,D-transpeptidase, partial [Trichothermofontia sp.]
MVRSFWPSSPVRPWHRLLGSTFLTVMLASPALAQVPEAPSAEASPLPTTELEALLPTVPPDINPAAAPTAPTPTTTAFNPSVMLLDQPALPQLGDSKDFLPDEARTRLVLRLGDRRVYVYRGDEAVVSYPVAIGRSGWETPKGSYEVIQMTKDPAWRHPWEGYVIP